MIPDTDPAGEWSQMRAIVPRAYVCQRAARPIPIDGRIDPELWRDVPWTDDFVDIEGARKPVPRFRTRAKMLWDEDSFYVAAEMVEPHVCAFLTERNSIIFHDNDFEIFIDPDADNHNYNEFEINALGTIWELTLPKPYKDGGHAQQGTNLPGLKSAVQARGTLNDPRDIDEGWSVVVALPWMELARYNLGRATPPDEGDIWRVNFSRVQWKYDVIEGKYVKYDVKNQRENNWVWSPQGIIDMHRPERWGFVIFTSKAPGEVKPEPDPTLSARDSLMEVYHRQRVYRKAHDRYATALGQLGVDATCITLESDGQRYLATTTFKLPAGGECVLSVTEGSKLTVSR